MNILIDMELTDGTEYFAIKRAVYDGKQYTEKILSVSNLTESISDSGYYETSDITVVYDDQDGHFRDILADATNKYIYGINVILRQPVTGTIIRQLFVEKWILGNEIFTVTLSDKYGQIEQHMPDQVITSQEFPYAPSLSIGKPIATIAGSRRYHGVTDNPELADTTRAYYVNGVQEYIISPTASTSITAMTAHDPAGGAYVGAALVNSGGYYWVNYDTTGPFEYVLVHTSGAVNDVGDMVEDVLDLFNKYTNDVTQFDGMTTNTERYYQANAASSAENPNYTTALLKTGKQILKETADSFNAYYYIDKDKVITFKILDYTNLTADKTFQEGEIIDYGVEINPNKMYNRVIINYAFCGINDVLEKTMSHDHLHSQDKMGTINTQHNRD